MKSLIIRVNPKVHSSVVGNQSAALRLCLREVSFSMWLQAAVLVGDFSE